jgi:hypothetical protein
MQVADESTVAGDFGGASYTHFGVTSRFFRRDGGFFVRTDGPDGELADYRVEYTLGAEPLQQREPTRDACSARCAAFGHSPKRSAQRSPECAYSW